MKAFLIKKKKTSDHSHHSNAHGSLRDQKGELSRDENTKNEISMEDLIKNNVCSIHATTMQI